MLTDDEVTTEWLQKELSKVENDLNQAKRQSDKLSKANHAEPQQQSPLQRLIYLQDTVEYLQLADDIVQLQKKNEQHDNHLILNSLEQQVVQCEAIGQLLCRHPRPSSPTSHYGKLFGLLWEEEYQPLYTYAKWNVIASLRQQLQRTGYPAVEACSKLLLPDNRQVQTSESTASSAAVQALDSSSSFASYCQNLTRLQLNHQQVMNHVVVVADASFSSSTPAQRVVIDKSSEIMVVELLRPIVERVQYHFLEKRVEQQQPSSKPFSSKQEPQTSRTISRLDHLPEWIIAYIRDNVLVEGGPWDLVRLIVAPNCVRSSNSTTHVERGGGGGGGNDDDPNHVLVHFLNEVVRMIQWVLIERNFFRNPQVAGPRSNPLFLCRAIEQLMTLDAELRDLLAAALEPQQRTISPQQQGPVLLKLTDIMLAQDEDLMIWWMEREREFVLSTLFGDDLNMTSAETTTTTSIQPLWQLRVAPRAELFCVLMRSIQAKAANFTVPGPYMANVAVPLCMQFLDAIHETARDLRGFLSRRKLPEESDLRTNLLEWMDLINGTYLSASVLLKGSINGHLSHEDQLLTTEPTVREVGVDHDLTRLGRSLGRLQVALVDEFGAGFVEILLMERAKLASYLMQAPFMLSHAGDVDMYDAATGIQVVPGHDDLPAELQTVRSLLQQLMHVCDAVLAQVDVATSEGDSRETEASLAATWEVASYAAQAMKKNVMDRLADKFLEIVLDEGMVPEIVEHGARAFAWNIRALFGDDVQGTSGPLIGRLMEVASFFMLDSKQLMGLKSALMGLTRTFSAQQQLLDLRQLAADGTIYDEAVSMIRAKGLVLLDLEDVISILNRRRGIVV